ncbi:hypothetical protein HDU67_001302 [Dinochytrium kinnereticum]|nr:hypothetical protein HDU67_001302 [Dinochytrium kinnereticum]
MTDSAAWVMDSLFSVPYDAHSNCFNNSSPATTTTTSINNFDNNDDSNLLLENWAALLSQPLPPVAPQPIVPSSNQTTHHIVYVPASTAAGILSGQHNPIFLIPSSTVPGSFVPAVASATSHLATPPAPALFNDVQLQQPFFPAGDQLFGAPSFTAANPFTSTPNSSAQSFEEKLILDTILGTPPMSPSHSTFEDFLGSPSTPSFPPSDVDCLLHAFTSVSPSPAPCSPPPVLVAPESSKKRKAEEDEEVVVKRSCYSTSPTPMSPASPIIKLEHSTGMIRSGTSHKCTHPGCEKTFSRRSHLVSHIITHTDQKNYVCDACPAVFARCHDLQRHQRTKHVEGGGKAFSCKACGIAFARKDSLKKHVDRNCKGIHVGAGTTATA